MNKSIRSCRRVPAVALVVLSLATAMPWAQTPTTAFNLIGVIEHFELCGTTDPGCPAPGAPDAPLSAARIRVNGIAVVLPKNLVITMPGAYMTAQDLFRGPNASAGAPVLAKSGLALDDPLPTGMPPHTAEIVGNIVGGVYIAGIVRISHGPLQVASGYISAIDRVRGELLVGPEGATTGLARVRLNDPTGRFGRATSPDVRFTMDIENPTVHASTGYPLCIPRSAANDALCPDANRPTSGGRALTRFTIGPVAALPDAPACPTCNPNLMAPLAVGDYVSYSGIPVRDAAGQFTSAYSLEADVGVFTSRGANPVYVSQEETLIGTGGIPFPGLDQETGPGKVLPGQTSVTRFRVVGFTTDPSRNVDVFAVDVNPITGKERERRIVQVRPESIAPVGRFRVTVDQSVFLPPTMEIRTRVQGVNGSGTTTNGLTWGEYSAPVGEYIFPEGRVFGQRALPANFENLCFLSQGTGPLTTLDRTSGPLVGRLLPWPDSGHPVGEVSCVVP